MLTIKTFFSALILLLGTYYIPMYLNLDRLFTALLVAIIYVLVRNYIDK